VAISSNSIIAEINNLCNTSNIPYIDAIVHWCEKNKVEIEYAAGIIKKDPVMRAKLQMEAENLNIIKRGARLPI